MGDGKVKLGRGTYAISTAILSMHAGFQYPGTKYMLAPGHRKFTFLCGFSCGFAKLSFIQHLFAKPHEKTHAKKVKCLELS